MAITFVNKGTWAAGTTSISPGIPASMQAGDFMILQVHTCNQAVTTPTGWTQATTSPVSTGTAKTAGGTRISVYYRWWQSGDAAPTVAVTGGTVTNGIIVGYRGVDQTTPFDGVTPVATTLATASTTLTMTGLTTATNNALIHWAVARDQDLSTTTAVTAYTNANLTGITETHDQVVNTGVGGGIWCGRGFKATAGATGNTTITQTSSIAVGLTIALRPAPNNYQLTCTGGAYSLTGGSANITRTYNGGAILQSAYNVADSGSTATTISATLNGVTAGSTLVAFVGFAETGSITCSVSDGTAYTAAADGKKSDTVNSQSSQVFYLPNAGSGNHTITATFSALTAFRRIRVFEIAGLATSSIEDGAAGQFQTTVGTTTDSISSTATGTTSNAKDFVLGLTQDTGNTDPGTGTMAAGTGFTLIGTNQILAAEYKNVTSTGAQTATFTDSKNSNRTTHVLVLKTLTTGPTNYQLTAQGGSYTVTGSSAILKRSKYIAASGGSYTLTGAQAVITYTPTTINYSFILSGGSYTLTGASATLSRNRTLMASGGAYTLGGANATLLRSKRLTANGGSYTVTGGTASLLRSKKIVASGGSYVVSGASANLLRSRLLVAQGGSYTYTGQQVTITYTAGSANYTLTCSGGSYAIIGASAVLSRNRTLTVSGGSYSITGASALLYRNRKLTASGGSYNITGATATILRSKVLVASGGVYSLTGQSAILSRNRMLVASGGAYTYQGSNVVITKTSIGGYPAESDVLLGVVYGPSGEYTGTLDIGKKFRIDIATGNIVMIIDEGKVMSL